MDLAAIWRGIAGKVTDIFGVAAAFPLVYGEEGFAKARADGLVEAYPDPATGGAPWTIGAGTTGRAIGPGVVWTQERCFVAMGQEIGNIDHSLGPGDGTGLLRRVATSGQRAALISFAYNLGLGSLAASTLLRLFNAGDDVGAANEFGRWVHAAGKVMPGLVKRRAHERAVFEGK